MMTPDEREAYIRKMRPSLWLTEHANFILRRLDEARAQSDWRPIETAPREDNASILLYWPYWSDRAIVGWWSRQGFWDSGHTLTYGPQPGPTYWMPLPPAPLAE